MTAVPAALDALIALFTAQLPAAQIIDGPPVADVAGDVVAVGMTPQEPADVRTTESEAGLRAILEAFDVPCLARSWSGDASVKIQRDRTYALIGQVKAGLLADPTLGGAAHRARYAGASYNPWRSGSGQLVVDVPFVVRVQAFTR